MMSKKQWFVLLCLFIVYLLLGASFFYQIEKKEEERTREIEKIEREEIEELLAIHYIPSTAATQDQIFKKLSTYCGKPMHTNMSQMDPPIKWDFYHSLFFVITVVSTIGYGNLAPTTMFGRIFMIFYGLVGIPINGIVMVTLGEFFGKKFTKLYNRWKSDKMYNVAGKLGLIGQISLYLVPGFTFFIFIPSVIIMYFEGWDYDVAVYYSFVTLTTIGFGDYVAGTHHNGFSEFYFTMYKTFLLVWIIIGLGYVVMILGFISSGLRSKRMHALEHMLSENIKRTPTKFNELKSLIHEIIVMKIKPVYKDRDEKDQCGQLRLRSKSCPNIFLYDAQNTPMIVRKRAHSECAMSDETLQRVHSDTNLNLIDKELTFKSVKDNQRAGLLLKFTNTLTNIESMNNSQSLGGIDCFSDEEILESEMAVPTITIKRERSCSEFKLPLTHEDQNEHTWFGQTASQKRQELQEKLKYGRARSKTLPVQQEPLVPQPGLFSRIRKQLTPKDATKKEKDVEKQDIVVTPQSPKRHKACSESQKYLMNTNRGRASVFSLQDHKLIAETIAEVLMELAEPEVNPPPRRKFGTVSPPEEQSPPRLRRHAIRPSFSRRSSMIPPVEVKREGRRFSLTPQLLTGQGSSGSSLLIPPSARARKYSLRPTTAFMSTPSPIQRRIKTNKEQISEEQ